MSCGALTPSILATSSSRVAMTDSADQTLRHCTSLRAWAPPPACVPHMRTTARVLAPHARCPTAVACSRHNPPSAVLSQGEAGSHAVHDPGPGQARVTGSSSAPMPGVGGGAPGPPGSGHGRMPVQHSNAQQQQQQQQLQLQPAQRLGASSPVAWGDTGRGGGGGGGTGGGGGGVGAGGGPSSLRVPSYGNLQHAAGAPLSPTGGNVGPGPGSGSRVGPTAQHHTALRHVSRAWACFFYALISAFSMLMFGHCVRSA